MSHAPPTHPAVSGLILAAGSARRMGRQKLLLPVNGAPLAQRAVDLAARELATSILVLGADGERMRAALRLPQTVRAVTNERHAEGLASSLACGLAAMPPGIDAALVLLADQPDLAGSAVRAMLTAAEERAEAILRASYDGEPGHPVLLRREVWDAVSALRGDAGARALTAERPEIVGAVALPGPAPRDVDTPGDYARTVARGG